MSTNLHPLRLACPTCSPPDTERHAILDVLRGFALYGVLLANLVWLTTDMVLADARLQQLPTAAVDPIARTLVAFFIDGKFYTLFAFLFGLGFALQMHRAERRGSRIVSVYIRRLSVLLFIGAIHIVLIWYGDILLLYAELGFALLLFQSRHPCAVGGVCLQRVPVVLQQHPLAATPLTLAPVGRMALTNYLTQSVLYLVLFTGAAGRQLLGRVGPAICLVLSVVIFGIQMAVSGWWLQRYRFGPAEWVWRTLTYGGIQPM